MQSPREKIRDTALQVMELKSLIGVLTSDANFTRQDKAATKLEELIPDLAAKFQALDISIAQQSILRERIQTEIGILLERRLYYVVQAKMLHHCLSINPNPIRLQEQILAGLSFLISGGTEKPYIYNAIECVEAGGIVDSENGLAQMMGHLLNEPEGHVSYRATSKKDLALASMATRICSGLIQNMVESGYLLSERSHGAVVTDALCLMSAVGGKEGAQEALRWMAQFPEMFKLERELYNYPNPELTDSDDRVVDLATQVFKKTASTNILAALYEVDVERYHKACNSLDVRVTVHHSILGDVESFDLESIRGAGYSLLETMNDAVRRRFALEQPLSEKRGKMLLRALQVNGVSVAEFVAENGGDAFLNKLRDIAGTAVPEPFLTEEDAIQFMKSLKIDCNAVLFALLTRQKELLATLKTHEPATKLVSALMIYHHGIDAYDLLELKRDHLTHLELIAYGHAEPDCHVIAIHLRDDFLSTWKDPRTMDAIRNFDPVTFDAFAKLYPDIFTEAFVRDSNWKNLYLRKKLFTEDLCI